MKKTTKLIALFLCVLTIMASFAGCSSTATEQKLEYEVVDDHVVITKYTDSTERTEITVPDELDGKPVTEIKDFSLFNAESLKTIYIGKNVETIGEWSMTNNQHLEQFVVDEENPYFCSVDGVLFTKDMKTIVYFPPAKNIEFNKYGDAQNKTTYAIPEGVEIIRSKAFYKCYYVEDITIPSTVKRIEEKAFHRTAALYQITLPEGLEYIGKDAFAYCFSENYENATNPSNKTEIVIPSTVKEIGEYAFFNCEKVSKVTMLPKENEIKLGKIWSPSTKGKENKDCEIIWENK